MKVMVPEFSFLENTISFCKHGIVLKVLDILKQAVMFEKC